MITVDPQLTTWIAHFIPPVHAMPRSSDRSSDGAACWAGELSGVGGGASISVLMCELPVVGLADTRIFRERGVVCPFRETNGGGAAARQSLLEAGEPAQGVPGHEPCPVPQANRSKIPSGPAYRSQLLSRALTNLPPPLTILHVTAPAEVGGLESVVTMLARGHKAMGHRVCVAGLVDPGDAAHPFLESLASEGVEVSPIALPTRAYGREREAVRRLCASLGPDVVHTHGYRSDVVDGSVGRSAGIPTVTTVHGFTGGGVRNRVYEWIQERAFRGFDAVVAVSEPIARRLEGRGVARERIHVIPNAFDGSAALVGRADARERLGIPRDEFSIAWVGRLSEEKGPDVFIDAVPLLAAPRPTISIIGGGPDEAALRQRSERLGISDGIRWHGLVRGAGALLAAFDALVLSSRTEGIPIVLLEAAAAGTPIVATRVGGVPSMFAEGEALLVPPGDPRALAAAIDAVRSHPAAARERAEAARQRLERDFAPGPWLERYEALYRSLGGRQRAEEARRGVGAAGGAEVSGC